MSIKSYTKKLVISGDVIELYEYEKPILEGYSDTKKKSKGRQAVANDEDKKINREKVLNRARRDIRGLVNSNIEDYSKFLTLTFRDNITDIKAANYEFKKFIQRLDYKLNRKIKYLVVPEIQKKNRGVWHYHVVLFNMPYVRAKLLEDIWGNGFIRINKIDHVDNVGAYVCKYLTKDGAEELEGKKSYFTSRSLKKPIEIKENELIKSVEDSLSTQNLKYANTFENDFNTTLYKQYNIKYHKIE